MNSTPRRWIQGLAVCGCVAALGLQAGSGVEAAGVQIDDAVESDVTVLVAESTRPEMDPREAAFRADPMVQAYVRAYGELFDSVSYREDDVVFSVRGQAIHFMGGRMLAEGRLDRRNRCDPLLYRYPLELPTEPAVPSSEPVRFCSDLQEVLWGRTEEEIRRHARSTTFLSRRMFVNDLVADALQAVERDINAIAASDRDVAAWISEIDITYSFIDRGIAGTRTRSQHSWGLAVDFVPNSYEGRQVYWRWTRAWNRSGWHRTPLEQRWSPPAPVIEIFERHGFLWGGKWAHFDNLHFEYRPEILEYNRILAAAEE